MKLATALSERSDIQTRISELGTRLNNNARVQEGDTPAESPDMLLAELNRLYARLEELMARINRTNSMTMCGGQSLTDLLAHRDCLKKKIEQLRNFLNAASNRCARISHTEIRILSTVPVADLQHTVDLLCKDLRQTEECIQELNWTTELL